MSANLPSLLRAPFVRQIGSYLAVAVVAALLYATLAPPKVVVKTQTVEVVTEVPTAPAPRYASEFMKALCARDIDALVAGFSRTFVSEADIRAYEKAQGSIRCVDPVYIGSFRSQDTHVFTAIDAVSGAEVFWVLTFDADQKVTGIE